MGSALLKATNNFKNHHIVSSFNIYVSTQVKYLNKNVIEETIGILSILHS